MKGEYGQVVVSGGQRRIAIPEAVTGIGELTVKSGTVKYPGYVDKLDARPGTFTTIGAAGDVRAVGASVHVEKYVDRDVFATSEPEEGSRVGGRGAKVDVGDPLGSLFWIGRTDRSVYGPDDSSGVADDKIGSVGGSIIAGAEGMLLPHSALIPDPRRTHVTVQTVGEDVTVLGGAMVKVGEVTRNSQVSRGGTLVADLVRGAHRALGGVAALGELLGALSLDERSPVRRVKIERGEPTAIHWGENGQFVSSAEADHKGHNGVQIGGEYRYPDDGR